MAEKKEKKYVSDNAQLMQEWDWEKNNTIDLNPYKLTIGSHKHAFWICATHKIQFEQEIRARAKGKRGCPRCNDEWGNAIKRERYIKGKKVLAETHPDLAEEYYESNLSQREWYRG